MTPNDLEILIHYYVSIVPHPRLNTPEIQHSITYSLKIPSETNFSIEC